MSSIEFQSDQELFQVILKAAQFLEQNTDLRALNQQVQDSNQLGQSKFDEILPRLTEYLQQSNIYLVNQQTVQEISLTSDPGRIYIDGCWDLMHSGHYNAIRQAKMLGQTLVVGIHSDEEIARNKGMPVMNLQERVALVQSCKWVDEIALDAPYSPSVEWLDKFNCRYIAHGDDCPINSQGVDAYQELKDVGRFKVIKRTEGISTTQLVGKLLLMIRDPYEVMETPQLASDFLTTSRRIYEFGNGANIPTGRVIYVDGAFDLFHIGHLGTLKKAKELGDFLIVGVHDDQTVHKHKGSNFPIMNLHERVLNVLAMQVVDEVVIGAPWEITQDLITSFNICFVVQGTISKVDEEVKSKRKGSLEYIDARDPYAIPRELGIYREVQSEYPIETKDIIKRIIDNRMKFMDKHERTSQKEANYYSNKVYIAENQ